MSPRPTPQEPDGLVLKTVAHVLEIMKSLNNNVAAIAKALSVGAQLDRIDRRTEKIDHELDIVRGLQRDHTDILNRIEANTRRTTSSTTIHVTAVELKPQENRMPPVDHMPDMQLPSASVRAKLSVHNPRKADGSRIDTPTWSTSDETQLPLEAIADANVQVPDPNWVDPGDGTSAPLVDQVDPADGQPNKIYSTYANTPLEAGEGTVTFRADGIADCDIKIKYSDPPVGHVAIVGVEAVEE